jgi:hypothetical protein
MSKWSIPTPYFQPFKTYDVIREASIKDQAGRTSLLADMSLARAAMIG